MSEEIPEEIQEDNPRKFGSIKEFLKYYDKNKEELKNVTTYNLNQRFHVDGYIIRKIHGAITFRRKEPNPEYYTVKNKKSNEERLKTLETAFNQIVEILNLVQTKLGMI
jgi:hypothetical protein